MKTLAKEFDALQVNNLGGVFSLDPGIANSGWRQVVPGAAAFVNDTFFDLAGLSMDDKTLFFEGAAIQDVLNPQYSVATVGDGMFIVDIMSKKALTDTEVQLFATVGNINTFNSSTLTFDQTIYGRVRYYNIDIDNAAGNLAILLSDNQLGSLSPSAGDRIYCYRYVAASMAANGFFTVFPARYLIRATATEEPEYQYLMRLKRSYELQQRFDRD